MDIKLTSVRLSYPNLFEPRAAQEGAEKKYSASLVMQKNGNEDDIKAIKDAMEQVGIAKWGTEFEKLKKAKKIKGCLRDGSEKGDTDGYGDEVMFVNASNAIRVPVVDKDLTPLVKEDGKPYAGCYVNASIRLWAQDNKYGKRINAQLRGIQFENDGESFGDKPADPAEMFGDTSGEAKPKTAPTSGNPEEESDDIPF